MENLLSVDLDTLPDFFVQMKTKINVDLSQ